MSTGGKVRGVSRILGGSGTTVTPGHGTGDVTISGGHIIQDEGSSLPQRGKLNFTGAGVTATDDAGNDQTDVDIPGGGGGGGSGTLNRVTHGDVTATDAAHGTAGVLLLRNSQSDLTSVKWRVPPDYISGDITATLLYRGVGAATGDVRFERSRFRGRKDVAIVTHESGVASTHTIATGNEIEEYVVTFPAADFQVNDMLQLTVTRLGSDAADTLAADIELHGFFFKYTASASAAGTIQRTYFPETTGTVAAQDSGSGIWTLRDANNDEIVMHFEVPKDYESGDLTYIVLLRQGSGSGDIRLRRNRFRNRAGAAQSQQETNVDSTLTMGAAGNDTSYTFTVPAADFLKGDIIRVEVIRLGSDAADTLAATVVVDGSSVEFKASITGGGSWSSYSPAWTALTTNPAIGNGTLEGRFTRIGKTVIASVKMIAGTTTTFGSGEWSFSLPSKAFSLLHVGAVYALNTGVTHHDGTCRIVTLDSGGVSLVALYKETTGAYLSTIPFTWGSTDECWFTITYEEA